MNPYLRSIYQIFTAGRFANAYKFALARAIVKLSRNLDINQLFIGKRDLASCFLEYYWPLETTYHIRQEIDPNKDPLVMMNLRRLMKEGVVEQGGSLVEFKKRSLKEYDELLDVIEKDALDDVVPRFHTVQSKNVSPMLYRFTGKIGKAGDGITLSSDAKAALHDYGQVIDYMAIAAWAGFTEHFTTAPRLLEKISGQKPVRQSLSDWRPALVEIQRGHCFYCQTRIENQAEVGHVLPWSFVLEDRTWNLVLACKQCNAAKGDCLSDSPMLHQLLARNDLITELELTVGEKFLRHFEDWKTRNLSGHVLALYDQAQQDGFPTWMST